MKRDVVYRDDIGSGFRELDLGEFGFRGGLSLPRDVYRDDIAIDRAVSEVMNVPPNGPDELVASAFGFRNYPFPAKLLYAALR